MRLLVGLLYTAQQILDLLSRHALTSPDIGSVINRNWVASSEGAFRLAMRCDWIAVDQRSILKPSPRGTHIVGEVDFQERLRLQIEDFIGSIQPSWSKLIPKGRAVTLSALDSETAQCFRDAGLSGIPPSNDVVSWWDRLAARSRGQRDDVLQEIGRRGEMLSMQFETERVGKAPKWQSVESNLDGYDLLSRVSRKDMSNLSIEVKTSTMSLGDAGFFVTQNEWQFALQARNHRFHIWTYDGRDSRLAIVDPSDVKPHIPENSGDGQWKVSWVPYKVFAERFSTPQAHLPPS